jgi:hypothetical protein
LVRIFSYAYAKYFLVELRIRIRKKLHRNSLLFWTNRFGSSERVLTITHPPGPRYLRGIRYAVGWKFSKRMNHYVREVMDRVPTSETCQYMSEIIQHTLTTLQCDPEASDSNKIQLDVRQVRMVFDCTQKCVCF